VAERAHTDVAVDGHAPTPGLHRLRHIGKVHLLGKGAALQQQEQKQPHTPDDFALTQPLAKLPHQTSTETIYFT